ncbi:FadR/GntR family transcriptional regulator [Nocardiopsis sp. MG754419]|uniref:FadR/GntR family transcriptional regulator n=1 Tax=Nocardiopsis sp. MG754419 TaxID=2259865 RepID=UPI001BA64F63|nr:FCD domain-containing protein [Nocardiopsis sp. MG754419]MBR8744506.1 GntR family transcriptional regulator [Nocardiopsis sp. MG754419]
MVTPSDPAAEAVFRPVRAGSALEVTVERLMCAIRLGVVPAGDRFPAERDLAARLGISRITLREAIRHLHRRGYVESRRGRHGGTFVAELPPRPTPAEALRDLAEAGTDLEDLLAYRRGLETGAVVRLAEVGLTVEQVLLLERRLTDTESAGAGDYRRCDTVLHITLARMTGSAQLATALTDARMRVNRLMDTEPPLEEGKPDSDVEHREIARAVADRDPEAARRALDGHLSRVEERLRSLLG